jgi:prepilin-type N-terminal cleavage/methylation domain-containing protein
MRKQKTANSEQKTVAQSCSLFAVRCSQPQRGFTLVEMVVAVALFAIVMIICVDVLLSLINADRKAQALQSVMNNLNIALDGTIRAIREGNNFHCGGGDTHALQDCQTGGTIFAFEPYGNKPTDPPWVISYGQDQNGVGRIYKSVGGNAAMPITAPEVSIDELDFYVVGADNTIPGNYQVQPKVIMVVKGSAGAVGTSQRTTFHIQATAVQRVLDL